MPGAHFGSFEMFLCRGGFPFTMSISQIIFWNRMVLSFEHPFAFVHPLPFWKIASWTFRCSFLPPVLAPQEQAPVTLWMSQGMSKCIGCSICSIHVTHQSECENVILRRPFVCSIGFYLHPNWSAKKCCRKSFQKSISWVSVSHCVSWRGYIIYFSNQRISRAIISMGHDAYPKRNIREIPPPGVPGITLATCQLDSYDLEIATFHSLQRTLLLLHTSMILLDVNWFSPQRQQIPYQQNVQVRGSHSGHHGSGSNWCLLALLDMPRLIWKIHWTYEFWMDFFFCFVDLCWKRHILRKLWLWDGHWDSQRISPQLQNVSAVPFQAISTGERKPSKSVFSIAFSFAVYLKNTEFSILSDYFWVFWFGFNQHPINSEVSVQPPFLPLEVELRPALQGRFCWCFFRDQTWIDRCDLFIGSCLIYIL